MRMQVPAPQTYRHHHQQVLASQIQPRTQELGKEPRTDLQEQAEEPRNHQKGLVPELVHQIVRHQVVQEQEHQTNHHPKVPGRQMPEPVKDYQRALQVLAPGRRIILQE